MKLILVGSVGLILLAILRVTVGVDLLDHPFWARSLVIFGYLALGFILGVLAQRSLVSKPKDQPKDPASR